MIVGVALTAEGTDYAQSAPMLEQVEKRTGKKFEEVLLDGGYVSKEAVDAISEHSVTMYAPLPERKGTPDPLAIKPQDSAAMQALKERMGSDVGKAIYKERAATAETVNADLKTWRSLDRFLVRGTRKVTCVLLWNVLAYNILRWVALTAVS